ncbi:MAG: hypothetical protein WD595_06720 [Waddliaceae bacterium]
MKTNLYHFNEGFSLYNRFENNLAFAKKYEVYLVNQKMQITGTQTIEQKVSTIALKVLFNIATVGIFILTSLILHTYLSRKITHLPKPIDIHAIEGELNQSDPAQQEPLRGDRQQIPHIAEPSPRGSLQGDKINPVSLNLKQSADKSSRRGSIQWLQDTHQSETDSEAKSFISESIRRGSAQLASELFPFEIQNLSEEEFETKQSSFEPSLRWSVQEEPITKVASAVSSAPIAVPVDSPRHYQMSDEVGELKQDERDSNDPCKFPSLLPLFPFTNGSSPLINQITGRSQRSKSEGDRGCKQEDKSLVVSVKKSAIEKAKADLDRAEISLRNLNKKDGKKFIAAQSHLNNMRKIVNNIEVKQREFNNTLAVLKLLDGDTVLIINKNKLIIAKSKGKKCGVTKALEEIYKAKKAGLRGWQEALNILITHEKSQEVIYGYPVDKQQELMKVLLTYNKDRLLDALNIRIFAQKAPDRAWPFKACEAAIARTGLSSSCQQRWNLRPNPLKALELFSKLKGETAKEPEWNTEYLDYQIQEKKQAELIEILNLRDFREIYNYVINKYKDIYQFSLTFKNDLQIPQDPYTALFCGVLLNNEDLISLAGELFCKEPKDILYARQALKEMIKRQGQH